MKIKLHEYYYSPWRPYKNIVFAVRQVLRDFGFSLSTGKISLSSTFSLDDSLPVISPYS